MSLARVVAGLIAVQPILPALAFAWCVGGAPPARDPDDDGLNDVQEQFFGTDPNDSDTDDDGTLDSDEDNDGDAVLNKDEPTLFSLEFFDDVFAFSRRYALILEGTNLFDLGRRVTRGRAVFPRVDRFVHVHLSRRRNFQTRIYLRLGQTRARRLLGELLDGDVKVVSAVGETNALHRVDMHCQPGPPSLMGAAIVRFKLASGVRRSYVVIGGCHLFDHDRRFARTTVLHGSDAISVRAPGESVAILPARLLVPVDSMASFDPLFPPPESILVGHTVQVETREGTSLGVTVEDIIADLRIPNQNLEDDHDRDGRTSAEEFARVPPTDPLVWDTDADGLSDGVESAPASTTDPLDPDTDADGIRDGDE